MPSSQTCNAGSNEIAKHGSSDPALRNKVTSATKSYNSVAHSLVNISSDCVKTALINKSFGGLAMLVTLPEPEQRTETVTTPPISVGT